jgi:hypothetical protein
VIRRLRWTRRVVALALSIGLFAATITATSAATPQRTQWLRSTLVYHDAKRDDAAWQRHLMRVDENGRPTGQWLFDAAILTASSINGKDLMYAELTGQDLRDLLDQTFADAAKLDQAAGELAAKYGPPPAPVRVSITVPWFSPRNHSLALPGSSSPLDMGDPVQRITATDWYLDEINSRAAAAGWRHLALYGAYYHHEDAVEVTGDATYVKQFNIEAHTRGLSTVWVPGSSAPNALDGKGLGFDVVNVQPGYAFLNAQYEGTVDGSRLYAIGAESARRHQAYEYEVSSAGESPYEKWTTHQYLAIAQESGASAYPQVFFAGSTDDMFDKMTGQTSTAGDRWGTYCDLADYLAGRTIRNLEIGVPWSPSVQADGSLQQAWMPATGQNPTALRLDFSDAGNSQPWQGRLTVQVNGPGGTRTAFAQRGGTGEMPGYDSLQVPLPVAENGNNTITSLTITMSHQTGSPWPNVQRLVAAQYALPVVANGTAGEVSSASRAVQTGPHADSVASNFGYAAGKLTDGAVSPTGTWNWDGSVGWNLFDGRFTVTIDLGSQHTIASVDLVTHLDQSAAVNWPYGLAADIGADCAPRDTGIAGETCAAVGTAGLTTLTTRPVNGSPLETAGTISLPVADVAGRYVTVSGAGTGWVLLDEIEVKDNAGTVVSAGRPYTVTPTPSVAQGARTAYSDDSSRLVDGVVNPDFGVQFSQMFTGICADTGGSAQVTWLHAHRMTFATVWMADVNPAYGVVLPAHVAIQWRNQNNHWQSGGTVTPVTRGGPSSYARLVLPDHAQATGVRISLPGGSQGWYMLSEISTQ